MNTHANPHQELLLEFGRFGLLAHSVASQAFRIYQSDMGTSVTTVRIPVDLELRLKAMAAVGGISANRLINELVTSAMDELEESLLKERMDAYDNFINCYEAVVQDYDEMQAHIGED